MKLKTYLKKSKKSKAAFAKELMISRQTLYNLLSGSGKPSCETLKQIESITGGKVTIKDF